MKRVEDNTVLRSSINGLEMVVSLSGYAVLDRKWVFLPKTKQPMSMYRESNTTISSYKERKL